MTLGAALAELLFCIHQSNNIPLKEWLLNPLKPVVRIPVSDTHPAPAVWTNSRLKNESNNSLWANHLSRKVLAHVHTLASICGCNSCVCSVSVYKEAGTPFLPSFALPSWIWKLRLWLSACVLSPSPLLKVTIETNSQIKTKGTLVLSQFYLRMCYACACM